MLSFGSMDGERMGSVYKVVELVIELHVCTVYLLYVCVLGHSEGSYFSCPCNTLLVVGGCIFILF